jgi:gamma-glutamyl-gamma-aminobutyrate hydrolase PuuD
VGGDPIFVDPSEPLPPHPGGLCVVGAGPFGLSGEPAPSALRQALDADLPVLGIDAGFHAINIALGGQAPAPVQNHVREGEQGEHLPVRHRIFLAPGGKVAQAIGGSGFALASAAHTHGITPAAQAPQVLASAHTIDDGVVEALEIPGRRWVVGVQWRAHLFDEQPSGFDNLLRVLIRRARERARPAASS